MFSWNFYGTCLTELDSWILVPGTHTKNPCSCPPSKTTTHRVHPFTRVSRRATEMEGAAIRQENYRTSVEPFCYNLKIFGKRLALFVRFSGSGESFWIRRADPNTSYIPRAGTLSRSWEWRYVTSPDSTARAWILEISRVWVLFIGRGII